jgi:hypothetical protein
MRGTSMHRAGFATVAAFAVAFVSLGCTQATNTSSAVGVVRAPTEVASLAPSGQGFRGESLDRDSDAIIDVDDRCPDQPEDRDGYADDDGCPDLDDDGDGIVDWLDACSREPETRNGLDDDDGCPDHVDRPSCIAIACAPDPLDGDRF